MKKKILWNNIIKVVGYASLATLILQGLIKIYKKYKNQQKEKTFKIELIFSTQFMEFVQNENSIILENYWDEIKKLLNIDQKSKYEINPNKNETYMMVNNKVNIDQNNIEEWGKKFNELFTDLTNNTLFNHKVKVYISGSDVSYLGRLFKKNNLIPVIRITIDAINQDDQDNQDNKENKDKKDNQENQNNSDIDNDLTSPSTFPSTSSSTSPSTSSSTSPSTSSSTSSSTLRKKTKKTKKTKRSKI